MALQLAIPVRGSTMPPIQTVFVIVMENHNWADFKGSPSAPYLNNVLLPMASHCERYMNVPGLHPSLPNYLWLVAGTNFGILDDRSPATGHLSTPYHLAALLRSAGITWRSYQEDISGNSVPLSYTNLYAPRHNPFVYFDDLTGTNDVNDAYGIAHNRPYSELAGNLASNAVARFNFIAPNLCHDGHNSCAPEYDPVRQTDNWLAAELPGILSSEAYQEDGAVFITWDESENGDSPIGMIVLSPLARGGGYWNDIYYTHSSLLRTVQEIFAVTPWLGDAANATDLADLFSPFGFSSVSASADGGVQLQAEGLIPGRTNVLETSTDLAQWRPLFTNTVATNRFIYTDTNSTREAMRFYRLKELP